MEDKLEIASADVLDVVGNIKIPVRRHQGYRTGQWVKFKTDFPIDGAHETSDGYHLGIYQCESTDILTGGRTEEHIVVVDKDGYDVRRVGEGMSILKATVDPAQVQDLRPMEKRTDIPAKRLETMDPEWAPRA